MLLLIHVVCIAGCKLWRRARCRRSASCNAICAHVSGWLQTINDWYDRDIDAINEPYRPIPSGAPCCACFVPVYAC